MVGAEEPAGLHPEKLELAGILVAPEGVQRADVITALVNHVVINQIVVCVAGETVKQFHGFVLVVGLRV